MRILFVNRMASIVRGGGETFDLEISRYLQKLGCEVVFLSGIPLFGSAAIPVTHAPSHTLRTPYLGWLRWDQIRGGWRLRVAEFHLFETAAARWAMHTKEPFDIVQVCELPTFVDRWKRARMKQPVVMRLTAPNFHDPTGAVNRADGVIASGMTLMQAQGRIHRECVNVPNAVDTELFHPHASDFRARYGIADSTFVVLYVARFQGFKNHKMLLRAFTQFLDRKPDSLLVLAGSGPLEPEIRAAAATSGIAEKVLFLGESPFHELPAVYAACDLKVISSDYESFCFAALEAMATELPLVATDTGWVPRLIERDQGGRVVPRGEAEAMAGAMLELAGNALLRKRMGTWNRKRVLEQFGWESSARKLLALYQGLLDSRLAPSVEVL
ncbi:MAG TPA: glycosyltransferase family 4 protein [Kiritimatiellia bacterium]|jgi:glycosyltransferase involved in cell wall biosynthesis